MTNGKMLREVIEKSGFKYFYVAECMGISRYTLQNKLDGKTEFVASEIATLSRLLHLTEEQRELIFLANGCTRCNFAARRTGLEV